MSDLINITVVIDADTDFCEEVAWQVPTGTGVMNALELFVIDKQLDIDLAGRKIGIFGLAVPADKCLADGDRVEVYQPLKIDPKQARRLRAERAKMKNK